MLRITIYTISLLLVTPIFSQNSKSYMPEIVIDAKYGITMYKDLKMLHQGSDTIRKVNGYPANGYIKDFYVSGQLLHKGFYVEGKLKVYHNYFPNGEVERHFRVVDTKKSKMDIYYKDGNTKSKIIYIGGEALRWEDYYRNGLLEFIEVYDKDLQYYIEKGNYFEDGTPENTLVLDNKKKLIYTQMYFHDNGELYKIGQMKYVKTEYDYQNIGTWVEYSRSGKEIKEINYVNGAIQSEKDL